jgi:glycosyltransferase involved in cell wall biosynthesis
MNSQKLSVLSVVIPVYNEAASLPRFIDSLKPVLAELGISYELIFVDDGSIDDSIRIITTLCAKDEHTRLLKLTRNFGKEIATTAGIHVARGDAILTLDADGQHPVQAIPRFVEAWRRGAMVVVGRRTIRRASFGKRLTSRMFYRLFRSITGVQLDPNETDFRLIDKRVQTEFNRMNERNRITRGLIDWLGYDRQYVTYKENERLEGKATYSVKKLLKLAVDSAISLSISPLYVTAYIGAVVLPLATLLGIGMLLDWLLRDPLHLHATGSAYLIVFLLWLIGVLLLSQGIIGLYLSHIHMEAQDRPLYVVDDVRSKGVS